MMNELNCIALGCYIKILGLVECCGESEEGDEGVSESSDPVLGGCGVLVYFGSGGVEFGGTRF